MLKLSRKSSNGGVAHSAHLAETKHDRTSTICRLFKQLNYFIGYLHVDFVEVRMDEGKQYVFIAIDRKRKLGFAERQPHANVVIAVEFIKRALPEIPYKVHKYLFDNRIRF